MSPTLGTYKRKFIFSCCGILPENMAEDFAKEFIQRAGMTPARRGRIDRYPYRGGGGNGWTGFFPLKESYMVIDVYEDLNETEILLSSCKPERIVLNILTAFIKVHIGQVKEVATA